jgi:hypothetical protein
MIDIAFPNGKHNQIMIIDGLVEPALCKELLNFLKPVYSQVSTTGQTMGGIILSAKFSDDLSLARSTFENQQIPYPSEIQTIEDTLVESLTVAIELYRQEFLGLADWELIQDSGFQVQRYLKGRGFYRSHVDSFPATSSSNRVAAAIFYLNTVKDGGCTRFPLHDVSVSPRQGRLVLFPATWTHLHEGRLPISNDKWIISTFLLNKPFRNPHQDHPHDDHDH